jgi:hypothetical protein
MYFKPWQIKVSLKKSKPEMCRRVGPLGSLHLCYSVVHHMNVTLPLCFATHRTRATLTPSKLELAMPLNPLESASMPLVDFGVLNDNFIK